MSALKDHAHQTVAAARPVWEAVTADDIRRPTPCAGWDVQDLATHTYGNLVMVAKKLTGEDRIDAGRLATAPASGFATAADLFLNAVDAIEDEDSGVETPMGEMTAGGLAGLITGDLLVHTWDLAKAIGADYNPPESPANATLEASKASMGPTEEDRQGRPFDRAVDVPADASLGDKLAAWFGRNPNWSHAD